MRFLAESPIIPDRLLHRRDKGQVVFFCGAGVSMNAGLPNFEELTNYVVDKFDPPPESPIRGALPLDQKFNLLQQEYGRKAVEKTVIEKLSPPEHLDKMPRNHEIIRRISADSDGNPQIVTTNFDQLFEIGNDEQQCPVYLPELSPDMPIKGISYLHGRLPDTSHPQLCCLTYCD